MVQPLSQEQREAQASNVSGSQTVATPPATTPSPVITAASFPSPADFQNYMNASARAMQRLGIGSILFDAQGNVTPESFQAAIGEVGTALGVAQPVQFTHAIQDEINRRITVLNTGLNQYLYGQDTAPETQEARDSALRQEAKDAVKAHADSKRTLLIGIPTGVDETSNALANPAGDNVAVVARPGEIFMGVRQHQNDAEVAGSVEDFLKAKGVQVSEDGKISENEMTAFLNLSQAHHQDLGGVMTALRGEGVTFSHDAIAPDPLDAITARANAPATGQGQSR
jgi:hypothetical protein